MFDFVQGRGLISASILVAVGVASQAQAQSANEADSVGQRGEIADIVVTATRQAASLQRVPIAVTAISSDSLEQSGIVNVQDIAKLAPGVQILPQFKPGDAVFQIRGQFQSDTAPTIDPSVGVYFDDVYVARSAGSLVNMIDVERVEVLKGPQGTLFGKNTTGGAIRIISNKPNQKFEGYGKVSYESFDRYTLEGVVNLPLTDTLATRFAGQFSRKSDGFATNVVTGNPIDTDKSWTVRGAVKWDPTDRLSVLVQGDYTKIRAGGFPTALRYFIPAAGVNTALNVARQSGLGFNAAAGGEILRNIAALHGTRRVGSDLRVVGASSYTFDPATGQFGFVGGTADPTSRVTTSGMMANISYDMDFATLRSITAYRTAKAFFSYDVDGTRFSTIDSNQVVNTKQFSQELIVNGSALSDKLDWTAGGIYFWESPFARDLSVSVAALTYPSRSTDTRADATNKGWGVFAQGTFALTEELSATGGVRYSVDKRGFKATAFTRFANNMPDICVYTAANGLASRPEFTAPCMISQQGKADGQWSYTASLNYQVDSDKLVYVRTGRGYRAGGFNPRVNAPEVLGSFRPEIVTEYEFGLKADWLDRRFRTNLAMFYSKSSDTQFTVNGVSAVGNTSITKVNNIGTRKVKGFELALVARPAEFISFDAGVTYLHARSYNPNETDVKYVVSTPPWSWQAGTNVQIPFSDAISGRLRLDVTFRDRMHDGQAVRNPVGGAIIYEGFTRKVTLLSARFTLTEAKNGMSLAFFGRNLTNEIYEARAFNIASLGIGMATVAEPRVIGVELKVPFGGRD